MAKNLNDLAGVLCHACDTINNRINEIGEIPTSDATIKTWHTYTNLDWEYILEAVLEIDKVYPVSPSLIRDVNNLITHINTAGGLCDNILYPTIQETHSLPKRAREMSDYSPVRTVKSVTFRTMMQVRELYCEIIGLDLPNADSSQGLLDPTPQQQLFEF